METYSAYGKTFTRWDEYRSYFKEVSDAAEEIAPDLYLLNNELGNRLFEYRYDTTVVVNCYPVIIHWVKDSDTKEWEPILYSWESVKEWQYISTKILDFLGEKVWSEKLSEKRQPVDGESNDKR